MTATLPTLPTPRRSAPRSAARRALLVALAATLPLSAVHAQSAAWPDRPVRLIVPFPTGGATDIVSRTIAQRVSTELGRQVLVENRAGAGGTIGSAEAARAAPDGHTLLVATSSTHSVAPHLNPKLPYDPVRDFTPIAHLGNAASVVLVSPTLPVKALAELIDFARRNPGKLNYASSGNGTVVHLTTEAFKAQAGVFITHVPYKGTALSIPDLIAGNVHLLIDAIPSGMPHVKAGRVRALAVTGDTRTPLAPELPTVSEAGLKGFRSVTWFGLYGPAGMNEDLVRRIHAAFDHALRSQEVIDGLARQGVEPVTGGSPRSFADMVAADSRAWGDLVRARKITVD